MESKKIDYWKPNKATYNKIQQLKEYINFIAQLECSNEKDKRNAEEIIFLIENIDKQTTYKNWMVCLDIFDREVQDGTNKNGGFYCRKWSVSFESGFLEITAESKHTSEPLEHFGDDYYYYGGVYFDNNMKGKRIFLDQPITEFINDVKQYKKYITKTLNDVEMDINVW